MDGIYSLPDILICLNNQKKLSIFNSFGMWMGQIALGGRYSRELFNRHGDLRHIRRLRFWYLDKVLMEKYNFKQEDATALASFLTPVLNFEPSKRPTAKGMLQHPWLLNHMPSSPIQNNVEVDGIPEKNSEKDEGEAMTAGLENIAIKDSKPNSGNPKTKNHHQPGVIEIK